MAKQRGSEEVDFFAALPSHVQAINEAMRGLPKERVRVHYCYGNWVGSHRFDADYKRILPHIFTINAGTIVGEMANPRHECDALILQEYLEQNDLPHGTSLAVGVIDVKTPIVETPETVALRLERIARIEKIDPDKHLLGGTDCGFETFANFGNVPRALALLKLQSLVRGAKIASSRLGLV